MEKNRIFVMSGGSQKKGLLSFTLVLVWFMFLKVLVLEMNLNAIVLIFRTFKTCLNHGSSNYEDILILIERVN